jgi:hypothetical protein
MQKEGREDIKTKIENNGLVCDCGERIYEVGKDRLKDSQITANILIILNVLGAKKLIIFL